MKLLNKKDRSGESGNVLFLILIAVALFAALSYAVTQSTRSGGGSTEREQALLGSSAMTQYPTALRTSVIRMILSGVGAEQILFNAPSNSFGGETNTDALVFHPQGGGAVYQLGQSDVLDVGATGVWHFNAQWEVPNIGLDGAAGADVIAFLPDVSNAVCVRVNEELGVNLTGCTQTTTGIPDLATAEAGGNFTVEAQQMMTVEFDAVTGQATGGIPNTAPNTLQGQGCTAFSGQASGCVFDDDTNRNVYYSVLLER